MDKNIFYLLFKILYLKKIKSNIILLYYIFYFMDNLISDILEFTKPDILSSEETGNKK